MKRRLLKPPTRWFVGCAGSIFALLAAPPTIEAGHSRQGPELSTCRTYEIAAGNSPTLKVENANGSFEITRKKRRVLVTRDGRELPPEVLEMEGRVITVVNEEGQPLLMFGAFPGGIGRGGQLVYSADLDPASIKGKFGFDTKALDEELAVQLGIDSGEGLLVRDICKESPAERAGLQKQDVIVETRQEDDRLALSVLRVGRRLELSVEARRILRWPEKREVEAYLARAFGE